MWRVGFGVTTSLRLRPIPGPLRARWAWKGWEFWRPQRVGGSQHVKQYSFFAREVSGNAM